MADESFLIYDDGDGIRFEIPIADGVHLTFNMDDDTAREFVNIIDNKLAARGKF